MDATVGFVYVLDLRTCELIRKFSVSPVHHAEVCALTFCGGGSTIACMTVANELVVYHVDGTLIISITVQADGPIRCFDSDGEYAVGGSATGKLLIWKLDAPRGHEQVLEIPDAHALGLSALTVSTNASMLVTASTDGGIRIWQLRKAAARGRLPAFF
ncbi:hypothetical protein PsorP6_005175 [Peronosclerospora sorghi]|uniref:Uncharacterized protein n=1 Tax=Peronosclerospora sorghi TaxID=230839 RepID=A0ACC0W6D9_9STRA|nr:hypothetical protein PsorP6_005175 [Peronosclerospora sorghi]